MDRHGTYHSTVHAFCAMLQVARGFETAVQCAEEVWELYPPTELTPGEVLVGLVEAVHIPCRLVPLPIAGKVGIVRQVADESNMVFMTVRVHGGPDGIRWAMVTGKTESKVEVAVCLQPQDLVYEGFDLGRAMEGEMVVVETGYVPRREIVCHELTLAKPQNSPN